MAYCGKCLHLDVCKTADSCDGHVPKCKHFMDKDEYPKLRHGRWIDKETCYVCSLCGRVERLQEPYCHCGAKMDGDGNG